MYPTLERVDEATHLELCRWWRFLDSPGMSAIGCNNYCGVKREETEVMNRIGERIKELGGFNSVISKQIGWQKE